MNTVTRSHAPKISSRLNLGEVLRMLVNDGHIDKVQAEKLYKDRKKDSSNLHPIVVIAEQKWKDLKPPHKSLSVEQLSHFIAHHAKVDFYHIDPLKLDFSSAAQVMSKAYAERLKIMPISVKGDTATIATADPFHVEWIADLERVLNLKIKLVMANPLEINRYLPEIYNLATSINQANLAKAGQIVGVQNFEQLIELGKDKNLDANEQHVVNIVDWLLKYAFEQRASDIHLEPRRNVGTMRFRIDGVLHQVYQLPSNIMNAITSRIKLLGRMDMVEKRRPQDGRIKTLSGDGTEIELRLSTMPTAFGEKLVMRVFTPDVIVQDFLQLGFSKKQAELWAQWTKAPNGIILVTGPTGSGKTTTLYSTLKQLATPEVNVSTVEDPIEMIEPAFNQMQVTQNIGLGFAEGIRTLMRQDPDIIMVGEIRDQATADMAIQAALTGHLVLSTLHTNDAPSAVTRLLDLGVPSYLIHSSILGIMGQRLVRTLCQACKVPTELTDDEWKSVTYPFRANKPTTAMKAVGCLECRNTGYRGRSGIYEMLTFSNKIRKLITPDTDLAVLRNLAYQEGMQPLLLNGAEKIAAGLTTVEEVLKVAPPIEQ
ncbi:type II secretory pathway, ATPase PulE/Tfp pilus assembly pathway, ATPase PilB [Methylophilaceae bacterium 11]|jgi:general secretion pathway protein E|uniref:GspE/PulE family protein n=1 Tax=unclassified Methylotenera TaxID=2643294 RepID=UPI0003714B7C|nr:MULTISPECIES: GspE/PulE family protein [unclassified Methylotenera]EUJ09906.1 type II secretory pathway, ATPase PulE/Tfp pilus assembly pathway, ATPase PilB [Methylophilaceae bacterium 11]